MKRAAKALLSHLNSPFAASDVSQLVFLNASELKPDLRWLPHGNSRVVCVCVCSAALCFKYEPEENK